MLKERFEHFGNKSFLKFKAQGFPSFPLVNAYLHEKESFMRQVRPVHVSKIPANANTVSCHTIYKIKYDDDKKLMLKARIAPHGNEDSLKDELRSDRSMCAPTFVRILLSLSTMFKWRLTKIDVKSAFLQTGSAERDVYVRPPHESAIKSHYWLLLTAAYGLVNANAKWQVLSDSLFCDIGLTQLRHVPQLFYMKQDGLLSAVVVKIVDDILIGGQLDTVDKIVDQVNHKFKLGTIFHGPGLFRYYGLNILQHEDFSAEIDAEDKLSAVEAFPLTRMRRKEFDAPLNVVERRSFSSLNSSISWLGVAASPLCSFYSSHMQQRLPTAKVSDLVAQINALKALKKFGSKIAYHRPLPKADYALNILVVSDASRSVDHGQLCFVAGLLFGPMEQNSVFHTLSWISHKSKRPVKSIGAAEILAAFEAIDEGKTLSKAFSSLLGIAVGLIIALDTKNLYTSLSTRRNSIDRSIRADVNVIRYEFETRNVNRITWIPGNFNLADPGTKTDSPPTQTLQLMLCSSRLPIAFDKSESSSCDRFLG